MNPWKPALVACALLLAPSAAIASSEGASSDSAATSAATVSSLWQDHVGTNIGRDHVFRFNLPRGAKSLTVYDDRGRELWSNQESDSFHFTLPRRTEGLVTLKRMTPIFRAETIPAGRLGICARSVPCSTRDNPGYKSVAALTVVPGKLAFTTLFITDNADGELLKRGQPVVMTIASLFDTPSIASDFKVSHRVESRTFTAVARTESWEPERREPITVKVTW